MTPLVLRCGGFGEIVLLTALLAQLHARFGRPADVVASGPWAAPLLQSHPGVRTVFTLASRGTPYWLDTRQQHLVRWLRHRPAGPTWFCDGSDAARDLLRRAGIADAHVCEALSLPWVDGEHLVDRWIRFANQSPPAFEGSLPAPRERVASVAQLQVPGRWQVAFHQWQSRHGLGANPCIAIQAGNKRCTRGWFRRQRRARSTKYWPETRWAHVIRAVRELCPDHSILLLGVREEHRLNADIARLAGVRRLHNVAGDLPTETLLPLLERADSMISVDTGPAHAAAALGCPTVALFGTADPALYRPGGVTTPAVALTGELDGETSILGITPEVVVSAWCQLRAQSRQEARAGFQHQRQPGAAQAAILSFPRAAG
jgi:ADP-heptose:LPS heptosyltransferase